jgi:hypothetical protein
MRDINTFMEIKTILKDADNRNVKILIIKNIYCSLTSLKCVLQEHAERLIYSKVAEIRLGHYGPRKKNISP